MHAQETNKTEGDTYTIMYNEAVDKHNNSVQWSPVISAIVNSSALIFVPNLPGQIKLSCSKITWIVVQLLKSLFIVQILERINTD